MDRREEEYASCLGGQTRFDHVFKVTCHVEVDSSADRWDAAFDGMAYWGVVLDQSLHYVGIAGFHTSVQRWETVFVKKVKVFRVAHEPDELWSGDYTAFMISELATHEVDCLCFFAQFRELRSAKSKPIDWKAFQIVEFMHLLGEFFNIIGF